MDNNEDFIYNFTIPHREWEIGDLKAIQPYKWLDIIYVYDKFYYIEEELSINEFLKKYPHAKERFK